MIILFFGQPASGKTTLADALVLQMEKDHYSYDFVRIDGDKWREVTQNKDYSKDGRVTNLKSAFAMAKYLDNEGFTPVLSFVTPYKELRDYLCDGHDVVSIYLQYSEDRGRNDRFAKDFEEPELGADIVLNTSELGVEECIEKVVERVSVRKLL